MLGSVTPEGNLFFNAIGASQFRLRISQGGLLTGPRRQASARLRPYSDATGQLKQPLALERISLQPGHTQPSAGKARRDKLTGLAADSGGVSTDQRTYQRQDALLHSPLQQPWAGQPRAEQPRAEQPWAGQGWIPSGLAPSSMREGALRPTAKEINRPDLSGSNPYLPDLNLIA